MVTVFVRHKVQSFDRWKQGYDDFADLRKGGGVRGTSVHQMADDPNDVIVTHVFASVDDAVAFVNNPELPEAMQQIGVVSQPDIWITEDVEQTDF